MKYIIILLLLIPFTSFSEDLQAYKIFDAEGDEVKYEDILEAAEDADIIFFGESHNNPICHWFEIELTKSLYEISDKKLVVGCEMFESDDQLIIDEYLAGDIKTSNFEKEAKLWNNYKTDYKPIMEYAKKNKIDFIATNIPRRYAAYVSKNGVDKLSTLSDDAKKYFAPLPIEMDLTISCYAAMDKMMGHMPKKSMKAKKIEFKNIDTTKKLEMPAKHMKSMANPPKMETLKMAQAVKDATMAHFILENMKNDHKFFHFNGSWHSMDKEGIIWFIKQKNPELKILTIHSAEQDDLEELDEKQKDKADFIIVIDKDMTKTY